MTQRQFEKIYQMYFDQVYRYLLKLCGDEHVAEELCSETFFRALKHIDGFRGRLPYQQLALPDRQKLLLQLSAKAKVGDFAVAVVGSGL